MLNEISETINGIKKDMETIKKNQSEMKETLKWKIIYGESTVE